MPMADARPAGAARPGRRRAGAARLHGGAEDASGPRRDSAAPTSASPARCARPLALKAKLKREAVHNARADLAHERLETVARVQTRKAQVRAAVKGLIWSEAEPLDAEDLENHLDDLLDDDSVAEDFLATPLETHIARLCHDLGAAPAITRRSSRTARRAGPSAAATPLGSRLSGRDDEVDAAQLRLTPAPFLSRVRGKAGARLGRRPDRGRRQAAPLGARLGLGHRPGGVRRLGRRPRRLDLGPAARSA